MSENCRFPDEFSKARSVWSAASSAPLLASPCANQPQRGDLALKPLRPAETDSEIPVPGVPNGRSGRFWDAWDGSDPVQTERTTVTSVTLTCAGLRRVKPKAMLKTSHSKRFARSRTRLAKARSVWSGRLQRRFCHRVSRFARVDAKLVSFVPFRFHDCTIVFPCSSTATADE